jgi:hypothetical protein
MSASPPALAEAVAAQLERILESQEFAQSWRLKALLRYLVDKAVRGEQDELKEYSIALAVFERAPSFDPKEDTIVRAQARRLRQVLATYYHTPAGLSDPVRIEIPKGGYVPVFQVRAAADGSAARKSAVWWRRRWVWAAVGAAALLAVALVPVLRSLGLLPRPCVPDTWALAGNRLTVLGARGNTCWEATFPTSEPRFETMVLDRVVIADIDGDNHKEVLVNLCPQGPAADRGSLLCLEQSGKRRWEFVYGAPRTFGGRTFEPGYVGRIVRVVPNRGQPLLVTVANHHIWYPSQVAVLDPHTGRMLEDYWHPGWIYDGVLADIDGDGRQEFLFSAINNPGSGLGHAALGVLKIPPSKAPARPALEAFPGLTGGGEMQYLLFPLPDMAKTLGQLPIPAFIKVQSGHVLFEVPLPEAGGIVYYLDFGLNVLEARPSDNLAALHERLYRQGLLDHRFGAAEADSLSKPVRFPAAPDGNSPMFKDLRKYQEIKN